MAALLLFIGLLYLGLNFIIRKLTGYSLRDYKEIKNNFTNIEKEYEKRKRELEIELLQERNKLQDKLHKEERKLREKLSAMERELRQEVNEEINKYQNQQTEKAEELLKERINILNNNYIKKENKIKEKFEQTKTEILAASQQVEDSLEDLRSKEAAAIDARIREYEEANKENFYKLQLTPEDIVEIDELRAIKLRNPKPLNQAIFNFYYRNAVKDLVNRITKGRKMSGIYKLTLTETGQCYIGQSVDIGNRWMQHCKRGAGVDEPTSIKLYPAMRKHGIHNFKFEIIEEVPSSKLSEREKYWSKYFGAKVFGYSIKN